jgi:LDH2 family malate/lactate/ureidoglycolate dehydrogenase
MTLPMAGHKGYAIAVIMDMISGVLSGGAFGRNVYGPYQTEKPGCVGHLAIAINISAVQPPDAFAAAMQALIEELKTADRAQGSDEILYPGELEARNDARHRAEGLTLPLEICADLIRLADELGCVASLPSSLRS